MTEDHTDRGLERRLKAWAEGTEAELPAMVRQDLNRALKTSLKPVTPLPSNRALAVQFLIVFAGCAALFMAVLDKAGLHMMTAAQIGGLSVLLGSGGVFFASQLSSRMIPASRMPPLWMGIVLLAASAAAMALLFPWRVPREFLAEGWPCAVLELAIAVPAAVLFWRMARRGTLFASGGVGMAVTALAVFLSLIVDQSQCMFPQAPHLLVWHGGMAAILIVAGALTGSVMKRLPN